MYFFAIPVPTKTHLARYRTSNATCGATADGALVYGRFEQLLGVDFYFPKRRVELNRRDQSIKEMILRTSYLGKL